MDLDKYINDNLDELILDDNNYNPNKIIIKNDIDDTSENSAEDNKDLVVEDNEDLEEDTDDLYEQLYYKTQNKIKNMIKQKINEENEEVKKDEDEDEDEDEEDEEDNKINKLDESDDLFYYFNLINVFTKYYNETYDKKDNFFSGIVDSEKDTSTLMELFFEAIIEFKSIKSKLEIENFQLLNYIIEDKEEIVNLFDEFDHVYCLELENKKIFTMSLIVCLNYIYENNILENYWKIYNLKQR
jgi:hypothetical protein